MKNYYKTALHANNKQALKFFFTLLVFALFRINGYAQLVNVPVTGYNNDIIANGISGTNTVSTGTLPGVTQPTIGVDGNGPSAYSFCDNTYKWYSGSASFPTCGIPATIASLQTAGLTYSLQGAAVNNSLTVVSNTYSGSVFPTSGAVSLVTPASYGKLFVLYESVLNTPGPNITATITFTDLSTQVITGNTVVNWFTNTNSAYTNNQRVQNLAPGNPSTCGAGPYLFEMGLNVLPANYGKLVQSVSFAWSTPTGGAVNTVDYLHVMAVGGLPPCSVPVDQPTVLNLTSPSGTVINGTFTTAPSTPSGYITVAYPGGSVPVDPTSGTTYTVGNSIGTGKVVGVGATTTFSATGLYPGVTYDFYVYSYNSNTGVCAIAYNTISPLTGSLTTSGVGASLLISPYGDGGFETGTTLALNNWNVVNSGTNAWTVGTVPTGFTNRSAYISNNGGAAWAFTNNSVTASHIYKDITFPAGQTDITLSFNWKALGEGSSWDAIIVYTCPTSVTPTTGSPTGTGNVATWTGGSPTAIGSQLWNQGVNLQTFTACLPAAFAGTTQRIVITWKNDGSGGTNPPAAVDNIALVSSTPAAPVDQATALVLTPISTSQINGSFTAAASSPAGYVVVRYPNLATPTNPVNGTVYTVGNALGLGTVVSVGVSTTFINTGLLGGTTYDYYVYDYSTSLCAGTTYNTITPLTLSQATLPCGAMSGVIPVGPTAPAAPAGFPTLGGAGGALAYINTNGLGGNTILELQTDYTSAYAAANETYPLTFPTNPCIDNTKTLTVRPAAAVASVITLTSANTTLATVVLDGGSFITIDGRNGGTGTNKFIRIINTSSTAAAAGNAVMMRNNASNNTLTFLDLQASNLNPANSTGTITGGAVPGVVAILSSTAGASGNDNNTISNCDIHSATAVGNTLNVGIYAFNNTAVGNTANNDNNTITNCNIYDCFNVTATAGIDILVGNNNYTIANNSYYKSAALAYNYTTAAITHRGFWITPGASAVASSGFTITGNYIGGTAASCGGTAYTTTGAVTYLFNGIDVSVGTASFTSVQNNTVTNFNVTTANTGSTAFVGINIANGNVNVGTVTGNLIGSTTVNGAITFTATANTGGLIGIRTGAGTTINISNNTISGINLIGSATITPVFTGINAGGGTTVNITNNTVGSTSLANSINASSVYTGTASLQTIRGIFVNAGTTSTVTGNTIANMNTNLTSLSGAHTMAGIAVSVGTSTVSGNTIRNLTSSSQSTSGGSTPSVIGIAYTSTTAPAVISGNTIHTLKNTNTTTTSGPVVAGLSYGGPSGAANLIEKNNIHSLVLSSNTVNASAAITGMDVAGGQVTIRNNMVRLGFDENGNSIIVPTLVRGISKNTNIANIYFNSIYIGGTGVLSTPAANTFAFTRTAAANTDDIRNNIFVNSRSNATTGGKHYQISLSSIATLTLNYNDYYGVGTGTVFASNVGVDVATYTAGWVASDLNSQVGNPQFINPTGTAVTGDLHISPSVATVIEQQGINIASVTEDFDTQTRSALTPEDIGADAGNFNPVNACAGPPVSATAFLTVPAQVCGFVSKTVGLSGFTPQPGLTYQWQESLTGLPGSFVNVTSGTGANIISYTTAPLNASMYYQCVIGCTYGAGTIESASVQALINPAPVLAVTPLTGTSVCSGSNVDLVASGANTYAWAVNPGVAGYPVVSLLSTPNNTAKVTSRPTSTLASSTATPPATVATPTWTYTVTGTALNGCTATSSVVLNVINNPVVPVQLTYTNSPDPVCATGVPITFTVNNSGTIGAGNWVYNWYDQTGTTLLQSTTNTSSTDNYTPTTPVANGNYSYQVKVSNTVCPASYAVASPAYFVGYTSLNVVSNANCGDNGIVSVYPEGQTNFSTWYSNSFATGLLGPTFDAAFGNTNFTGGLCNITPQANGQTGALVIRNSAFINTNNLQLDFKLSTAPRGFAFNILGADGLCWSYGSDVTVGTITTGGQGEGGSGTGLKLAFDATANGPNNLPGCYLMFNSTTVGQGPGDPGVLAYRLGSWWQGLTNAPVSIIISQNGFVTVSVNNEVIFDHVALPASYLTSNKSTWIHSFTARTGGSNELHAIDDLNIRYNSYEYSNNSTTGLDGTWQSSNTFSGLAAGTYPMWVRNPSNTSCVSNVGNAVVGTSPSPSSAITVAAPGFNTVICAGSSTDLTTDVSIPGAVFLWESSANLGGPYVAAAGVNNLGIYSTGVLLANTYYRCTFTCPSSSPITSTPVLVTVNTGTIASTNSPVNRNCFGDASTLIAVPGPNTTCVWYANQTGGSPLFSGNSYTVTPVTLPATYYVEPVTTLFVNHYDFGGEKSVGGNLNGGAAAGTGISTKFNTSASIRIDSIKVLPNASGTLTVALQNAGSATNILTFSQVISAAQVGIFVNVPVNFAITGSGNYQLTTTGVSCSYNPTYPPVNYSLSYMNMGGVFSIVGGSTTATGATSTSVYGTAYNWSITTSCPTGGVRVPVLVQENPATIVNVTSTASTICEGDNVTLMASSINDPNNEYSWNPGGFVGSSYTVTPSVTTTFTVTGTDISGGINNGCQNFKTITVTVNQRPAINSLTALPTALCEGDSAQISLLTTPFIAPVGNYTVAPIPFSPVLGTMPNAGPVAGDENNANAALGFNFNYFGVTYTDVTIHANGQLLMGANVTSANSVFSPAVIPTAAAPNNWVGVWSDLNLSGSDVTWGVVGVSPYRQLVVNFTNVNYFSATPFITFQTVLNETYNTIDVHMVSTNGTVGNTRAIGLENSTGTLGTAAPSRNGGTWAATNESWRFSPPVNSSLTYAWSPAAGLSSTNVQNPKVSPSVNTTYTVTVAETGTGCTRTATIDINVSKLPLPYLLPGDSVLCSNDNAFDMVVVDSVNYPGGYPSGTTFDFFGAGAILYQNGTSNIFQNQQQSDSFYVVVTLPGYLGGCTATTDTSVIDFGSNQAPQYLLSTDSVACYGESNGKAKAEITFGGTPNFRYQWYDSGQNNLLRDTTAASLSDSLQGLPAGMYIVVITDHQGATVSPYCSVIDSVFVGESEFPLSVTENIANHVNVLCNGALTGVVDIDMIGGTVPYSYNWSNGTTMEDLTGAGVGTYTCTITDNRGCSVTISSTLTEPTLLVINCSATPVSCNGGSDGTASVTASGGTSGYTYLWSTSAQTATSSGLIAGTYTVTVTDANGCSTTCTSTVEEPAVLVTTCSSTNVTCRGAANGYGSVVASGGNMAYTYLWSNGNTTNAISGLIPGDYTVTVTDSKGCTAVCGFTITQPNTLKVALTATNPSSVLPSSGTITSATTGGTTAYSYLWNDAVTTADRTGIPGGTYTVTVTDALGCTATKSVTLTYVCSLSATNVLVQQASCFLNNGIMTVIPSGGTSYSYQWQTSPVQTTATGTGLAYGINSYCLVTDIASGCSIMDTVIVPTRKGIKATMGVTNINCNGGSNGIINLTVTGTTGLVTYLWSNGATTEDLNGISAGVYTVTITNGGCILTSFTTLTQPAVLSATASSTAASCGSSNGTATVTAVGGKGTYSYSWNTLPSKSTKTVTGLAAGSYTVTVTDANGCSTTAMVTVTSATGLTVTGVAVDVSCNGGGNGSIALTVSGGTSPYTYNWSNGSTVKNQNAVPAGTYTVTVTSVNGCTGSYSATITQPTAITATTSTTPAACFGGTNGTATIVVSGGTPGYTYSWNSIPVKTTATATGLKKGTYTCTVTDSKGCIKFYNAAVTEPAAIVISISKTNVSVFGGNNGTATANVSGGVSPYSYAWSTAPVQTTQTATGLFVGTYTVVVTDVNGCTKSGSVTITQPTARMAGGEIETVNSIVYPNPSNGMVTVSFDQSILAKVSVSVYTLTGNQVFTKDLEVKENATLFDLDLTGLAKGIYSIQYRTIDKQWIEKLVIQ